MNDREQDRDVPPSAEPEKSSSVPRLWGWVDEKNWFFGGAANKPLKEGVVGRAEALTAYASAAVAFLAILGLIVAAVATKTASNDARDALRETRRAYNQAFTLQGTQTCVDFRNHLMELQDDGLGDDQIIAILVKEDGVTDDASGDRDPGSVPNGVSTTGPDADTDLSRAYGCGDPRELLRALDQRKRR